MSLLFKIITNNSNPQNEEQVSVSISNYRYGAIAAFVEDTDLLNIEGSRVWELYLFKHNIKGTIFTTEEFIDQTSATGIEAAGRARHELYFRTDNDNTLSGLNSEKVWFNGVFGRNPSALSYREGTTTASELLRDAVIAGRNSECLSTDGVSNGDSFYGTGLGIPDTAVSSDWISRGSTTRVWETTGNDAASIAYGITQLTLTKSNNGFHNNFMHAVDAFNGGKLTFINDWFSAVDTEIGSDFVWRTSYGEAVEYAYLRTIITSVDAVLSAGSLTITIQKDSYVNHDLISVPISVQIDTTGTSFEGKELQTDSLGIRKVSANVFVVDIEKGTNGGSVSAILTETLTPSYYDFTAPSITSATVNGSVLTVVTDKPTKISTWIADRGALEETALLHKRSNTLQTSHDITLDAGDTVKDIYIGAITSEEQSILSAAYAFDTAAPVLSNFRVLDSNKDRVMFDSNVIITASTFGGFTISGKTISSISIDGDGLGGAFVVSSDFDFWDNNTIRYSGTGSDLTSNGNDLLEFTLEYIQNQITEPTATTNTYYVDVAATGTGDGSSEANAFTTLSGALAVANAGSTIWVKAGTYLADDNMGTNGGTASNPIKIIGYQTTIGDISTNYYDFDGLLALDATEMPVFDGENTVADGFNLLTGDNYTIIKNLQFKRYRSGITNSTAAQTDVVGLVVDNCNFKDNRSNDDGGSNTGSGVLMFANEISGNELAETKYRVTNSINVNSSINGFNLYGQHNLIEGSKVYSSVSTGLGPSLDYAIRITGSNNIIDNVESVRENDAVSHGMHGVGIRGAGLSDGSSYYSSQVNSMYNLIQNSVSVGADECFYVRNTNADNNVLKDIEAYSKDAQITYSPGIVFMNNAQDNIVERAYIHDVITAVYYYDGSESGTTNRNISGNVVRNSIIDNAQYLTRWVNLVAGGVNSTYSENKLINVTVNNVATLTRTISDGDADFTFTNNEWQNVIIVGSTKEIHNAAHFPLSSVVSLIDRCDFYNTTQGIPAHSTNSINIDPQFVDTVDFVPQNTGLNIGTPVLDYDFLKVRRRTDNTVTIGFKEIP